MAASVISQDPEQREVGAGATGGPAIDGQADLAGGIDRLPRFGRERARLEDQGVGGELAVGRDDLGAERDPVGGVRRQARDPLPDEQESVRLPIR